MVHPKAPRAGSPEDRGSPTVASRERAIRPPAASALRRRLGQPGVIDACLAVAVGLAVLLVHDVPYLLHQSFWVDEAWVADTVRAPIGLTHSLGLITPLGWTFLLRLVPFGGPERLRLVPLGFSVLTAVTGYLFGRELRLTRFTTGILTGAAALLSPAMLVENDLKQYTAEAFGCLVVWTLVARVENEWRLRRLVVIAAVASVGLLFANTLIFVGVAAMASLGLECLITRRYRRLIGLAGASAGMLVVSLVIYELVLRPEITPKIVAYWDSFYVPTRSTSGAVSFIILGFHHLAAYMGFPSLIVDTVLALAGIAALVWLRRYALAAMLPVTLVLVLVASAARKYPFGDPRTSTFWLVAVPVLMAVAVAAAGKLGTRIDRRAPLVVTAVALAVWVPATNTYIRSRSIPVEDVHSEVTYLDAHFRHGDVVIVSYGASYGFAYYYPLANPSFPADRIGPNGHIPAYPGEPWIIVMGNRRAVDVAAALSEAKAKIAAEGSGAHGRIWIIRSHQTKTEVRAWRRDLAGDRVRVIHVGPDPILLYTPS
jgi:hypothetical protein